ncbi:MAG: hypothetical protein QOC63_5954 [Mycobacterium sp.]|jgi:hypothetical protein|nr:hypothetical protein [Mycobacterium sp.]
MPPATATILHPTNTQNARILPWQHALERRRAVAHRVQRIPNSAVLSR